jgi:hypothetical protein
MDETLDPNKSDDNGKDDASKYLDCIRLIEGGKQNPFARLTAKFDLVNYEKNDGNNGPSKSLLFYAIEQNNDEFVRILLEMEISLDKKYTVSETINSFSYAH